MATYSGGVTELTPGEDGRLLSPDIPHKYQTSPATYTEKSEELVNMSGSSNQYHPVSYTSILPPTEEEEGSLRARIPASSVTLDEARRIQAEYEAPYKDIVNQNPIKIRDFKHPPSWFQDVPFSHTFRLAIGMFPALFVIVSLSGKGLLATLSLGALITYFTLNFSLPRHALFSCLFSVIAAEIINFFSLLPLVWRSFMNIPLFSLSYSFIISLGGLSLLQFPQLRVTEPAMCVLVEELMFALVPSLLFLIDMWACVFLFSEQYLGTLACLISSFNTYLYYVPLTSSFYRPGSTKFPVVILTRSMTAILTAGTLLAPCVVECIVTLYSLLVGGQSLQILSLVWVLSLQTFLLSLLGKARLFWFLGDTTGSSSPLFYTRLVSGCAAALTGSLLFSREAFFTAWLPSVPVLLLLAIIVAAVATSAERRSPKLKLACGTLLAFYLLCTVCLPWRIQMPGPILLWRIEFPFQLFLCLLVAVALLSVLLVYRWRKVPPPLYLLHLSGVLLCEYWLVRRDLYPYWMLVGTAASGMLLADRMHKNKALKSITVWIGASAHLSKLVWILPDLTNTNTEFSHTSALPGVIPGFIAALLMLGALRYDHQLVGLKRISYAGIMLLTLLLAQESIIRPLLSLAYFYHPTPADLLAATLSVYSLFVALLLAQPDQVRGQHSKKLLAGVVIVCGGCSSLLNSFKPSLDLSELWTAIRIITGMGHEYSPLRERGLLLAVSWRLLIDWSLFAIVSIVGLLLFLSYILETQRRINVLFVMSLLAGWLVGLRIALLLGPFPNILWQIYGISGSVTAYLLFRAAIAAPQQNPCFKDRLAFLVLLITFVFQFLYDYTLLGLHHSYEINCSRFWVLSCLAIALAFKGKQQQKKYTLGGDERSGFLEVETTYYPLIANLSCLIAYLSLILTPFQHELELTLLFGSAILLLMQNDDVLISSIRAENMLWPSLAGFDLFLHVFFLVDFFSVQYFSWFMIIEVSIILINMPFHFNFINAYKVSEKLPLVSLSAMAVPLNLFLFNLYSFPTSFFIASLACCFILQVTFWHRSVVLKALDG